MPDDTSTYLRSWMRVAHEAWDVAVRADAEALNVVARAGAKESSSEISSACTSPEFCFRHPVLKAVMIGVV